MKIRAIHIFIVFLFCSISYSQQNVSISGQAYDSHFDQSWIPGTVVTAKHNGFVVDKDTIKTAEGYELNFNLTDVETINDNLPDKFHVYNNFPEPFNPQTNIRFDTKDGGLAKLKVYTVLAQELHDLTQEVDVAPGTHQFGIEMNGYANGAYVYVLSLNDKIKTGKMMLIHGSVPVQTISNGTLRKTSQVSQDDEIVKLIFKHYGYATDSLFVALQPDEHVTGQNISLVQNKRQEEKKLESRITDVNGNVTGAEIQTYDLENNLLAEAETNSEGKATSIFDVEYIQDPLDSQNRKYVPEVIENKISSANHKPAIVNKTITSDAVIDLQKELELLQQNVTVDFTLHYVDIVDGIALNDADVVIKWPDDSVKTYTNNNGVVNVTKVLNTEDANKTAEMWHSNLNDYLHWMIGRTYEQNQHGKEPIFQNEDWDNNAHFSIEQLDQLDAAYVGSIDREVDYALGTLQTDGPEIMLMMRRSPGVVVHNKPAYGINTIRNVQIIENDHTGEIVPDNHLDRAKEQMRVVIAAYTNLNGIILENHEPIQRISRYSQEWTNYVAEDFENLNWTYFGNFPGNYVEVTGIPEGRKKYSSSKYPSGQPNSVILAEIFAQFTNTAANSLYLTYTTEAGELSGAAEMMLRANAWFGTETKYYK